MSVLTIILSTLAIIGTALVLYILIDQNRNKSLTHNK